MKTPKSVIESLRSIISSVITRVSDNKKSIFSRFFVVLTKIHEGYQKKSERSHKIACYFSIFIKEWSPNLAFNIR